MANFTGMIIAESLSDASVLEHVTITSTAVESVTPNHATPWLTQWTLHTVSVPADQGKKIANELSMCLEADHPWYADLNNGETFFVIYRHKIFTWRAGDMAVARTASEYGRSLGIPEHQLDFPV